MKILFICKYNRLRSKIAEAMFNLHNKNKVNEAKSAGVRTFFLSPFIVEKAKKVLEQRGAKVESDASLMVNDYLIKWADKIIIVANDIQIKDFPKEKISVWEVEDLDEKEDKQVMLKIDEIESKVKGLLEQLDKNDNKKIQS